MHWMLLTLASAVFLALYDLAKKASVRGNAVLPVLLCSTLCGCAAYGLGLWTGGGLARALSGIGARTLLLGISKSALVAASWVFTFKALQTLPVTIATPIRASSPALVFVIALLLYGEVPTPLQGCGMLLVFAGYFAFSWAGRHEGIDFLRNRAVWCAVVGALLSAASAIWDKYVFQVAAAPVETVQLVFQLGLVLVYGTLLLASRPLAGLAGRPQARFEWRWTIPLVGVLLAVADWLYFHALALPEVPVSVVSLVRRFSVVITFALGAVIFGERNLRRKSLALALVLSGLIILALRFV